MRKTFLCFAAASWLAWSVSVGLAQSSGASGSGGTSEAGAGAAAGGSGAATGTTGSSATNAGNSVNTDNNLNRSTNQMNGAGAPAGQTGANFQGQNQTGSVIPGNAPMGSNAVGRPGAAVDVNTPGSRVGVDANRMGTEVDINRQGVNNNPNGRIDAGGGMNPQAGMNQSSAAGDSWRFQRYNSEWWYWMPGNYWMFYRDNNWSRYDPNTFRPMSRYRTAYRGPLGLNQNGTGVANPSLERLRDDARNLGQDLRQGAICGKTCNRTAKICGKIIESCGKIIVIYAKTRGRACGSRVSRVERLEGHRAIAGHRLSPATVPTAATPKAQSIPPS
jgi:hypothetical protein